MFSRRERVSSALFENVWRNGKSVHSPHLILKYLPTVRGEVFRLGVVAPKRVARGAVMRNMLRRRLYHAALPYRLRLQSGHAGILVLKNNAQNLTFLEVTEEMGQLFQQSRLLK